MTGSNDFFVNFGSNADIWANNLAHELAPAEIAITHIQTLLKEMNDQSTAATSKVYNHLKAGASEHVVSPQERAGDAALTTYASQLSNELVDMNKTIGTVTSGLAATNTAVQRIVGELNTLPAQLREMLVNAHQSLANAQRSVAAGSQPRDETGAFLANSAEAQQVNALRLQRLAARAADPVLGRAPAPPPAPAIRTVTDDQISTASADRIVAAIEAQTRALIEGLRVGRSTSGGGGTEPPTAGPVPPRPSGQPVQLTDAQKKQIEDSPRTQLAIAEGILSSLKAQDQADQTIKAAVTAQQARRDDLAAQVAKIDREERGVTRGVQSAERSAAAHPADVPAMTRSEAAQRATDLERIRRVGSETFLEQATTRGTQGISMTELRSTLEAFRQVGIEVAGARSKEGTAANLQDAHARFLAQYGDTVPAQLRTGGQILPEDKISEEVRAMVGDINGVLIAARQKMDALNALDANRVGGGGRPYQALQEYGSGTFGPGVLGDSATTRAAVQQARDILRVLPGQAQASAFDLFKTRIGQGGFDPYAPEVGKGIQGSGEEATATRLVVAALRTLSDAADVTAKDFYDAGRAVASSHEFLGRAQDRIAHNQGELGGATDPARIAQLQREIAADERKVEEAWASIARNTSHLATFTTEQERLFESAGFKQGFQSRTGEVGGSRLSDVQGFDTLGYPNELGYGTAFGGSRKAFQQRQEAIFSPQDREIIKTGLFDALAGIRTGVGTRETIRNVPGMTVRNGIAQPTDFSAYSNEDIIKLRQASLHAGAAQADERLLRASLPYGPQTPENQKAVDEAAQHLENAATRLLNQIQHMFHVAPPIQAVVGNNPVTNEGNARSEFQRQLVREALDERAAIKFRTTEADRLANAESAVSASEKNLAEILRKRAGVEARATAAAEALAKAQAENAGKIGKAGQAEAAALEAHAAGLESQIRQGIKGLPKDPSLQPGTQAGLYRAAALGPDETTLRRILLGGAQGPLPQVREGGAPQGPIGGDLARIQGMETEQSKAYQRLGELMQIDPKVLQEATNAKRALDLSAEAEQGYTAAIERNRSVVEQITATQNQVRQIGAARAAGLKKPDGSNITRADIVDAVPGISKLQQVTDILGPAKQSAHDKSLAAADAKIAAGLEGTLNAEERKAKAQQEAAQTTERVTQATKALTAAEESELATKKADRLAAQEVARNARTSTGTSSTKAAVTQLEEQAAAAERSASAKRGAATRAANAGDESRAAAAKLSAEAATADAAALRAEATAAREAKDQIAALGKRIRELEAAAGGKGGAGGTGKPPVAQGGGGEDENLLVKILAVLNQIHGTLEGGLRVKGLTGVAGPASTPAARARALEPTVAEAAAASGSSTDAEALAAAEAQRQRLAALGGLKPSDVKYAAEQDAKAQAEAAAATERNSKAKIDEARSALIAQDALRQLSAATIHEIDALQKMVTTGAEANQIVEQQARVYNSVASDLGRRGGVSAGDRSFIAQQALQAGGTKVDGAELANIAQSARGRSAFVDLGSQYGQAMAEGTGSGFAKIFHGGFFNRILNTTGTFVVRNFAAGAVFGVTNQLQAAITDAIKTQQTYVRLSSTLQSTGKDVGNLRTELQDLSSKYGVSLNDLYDTAAKLAGVFDTPLELKGGVTAVAQLQMISEGALSAQEGVGAITSIWAAFQDELKNQGGAQHIADVATALQNLTGVNVESTVEGVARIAGLAKQMGINLEEASVFVAQVSRETNTTGATAGEQLSRILEQSQSAGGKAALQQTLGADVFSRNTKNGQINYGNILKELIADWGNLSKAQQENLTHTLAGSRQAAAFNALMDNGAKTIENMVIVQNSQGAASIRMAALMKTLSGETARLRANFHSLVNQLVQTGFLDGLGAALQGVNLLLAAIDHLLALLNQAGESNPFIGSLVHMTAVLGGAVVAFNLLRGAIKGLAAASAENGVTAALLRGPVGGVQGAVGGTKALAVKAGGIVGGGAVAASEAELAATNIAVSRTEQKRLSAALALTASMDAEAAITDAYSAAVEAQTEAAFTVLEAEAALFAATAEKVAAMQAGTASEAQVAALNEAIAAADADLAAAILLRTEAEGAAAAGAEADAVASKGGLLKRGFNLAKANPLVAGVAAAGTVIVLGEKGQLGRVGDAQTAIGGKIPDQGATGDELRAVAKTYDAAAKTAADKISHGLFGTGIGPSLTKALDEAVRGSAPYDAARQNEGNQRAIALSLAHAADAMDRIEKENAKQLAGQPLLKTPAITSFDSTYLQTRLTNLTAAGQSAGQQLNELNKTLFGTGEQAKQAKGSYLLGGKPTNSLPDWIKGTNPALLKILSGNGVDVSTGGPDLLTALGTRRAIQAQGPNGLTTTYQNNLPSQYTAKNTGQATSQSARAVLAYSAQQLNIPGADGQNVFTNADLKSLSSRGFDKQVQQYKTIRAALKALFAQDRKSFKDLIGQVSFSHKDAANAVNQIMQLTQTDLSNLPTTDLSGRTSRLQVQVAQIRRIIQRTKGQAPTQLFTQLQSAQNDLAAAEVAQLDRTRIAAQAADHSKAGLHAAALAETRKAIQIAIKHNDSDLLAEVIQNSGAAGRALAKAAIRAEQNEIDAYKVAMANIHSMIGQVNATNQEAFDLAHQASGAVAPPSHTQGQVNQNNQAASGPAGPTNQAPWFTGQGVPGLDAAGAQKTDANQLRQDQAALIQARLGVAEAYATARTDAVAAAKIQVRIAAASISAARADLAAAKTQDERLQAQTAIASAQAQLIAAQAGVAQAEADLISSRFDVAIALADAAGRTVQAAAERAKQAQAALRAALKQSHGKDTAAVNQARAAAITAEAAVRDAKLQDELDTINFNLEIGKVTQSSAIAALQHILATENLTKQQRQQLMLQIKGMKDELANSQWNFGDIKLPTPYQMRRYIDQRKEQFRNQMDAAAGRTSVTQHAQSAISGGGSTTTHNDNRVVHILIPGADLREVKKLIKDVVGGSTIVRTTQPRRR